MKKADFLTGLALVLLSLYVLAESWRMPRLEHLQVHPLSVPGIVPAFLALILLIFGLILAGRSIRTGGHRLGWTGEKAKKALSEPGNRRLLWTALLASAYAGVLVGRAPYWLATGLFVFGFVALFERGAERLAKDGKRTWVAAAALAAAVTAAVSYTFERLFLVTLP